MPRLPLLGQAIDRGINITRAINTSHLDIANASRTKSCISSHLDIANASQTENEMHIIWISQTQVKPKAERMSFGYSERMSNRNMHLISFGYRKRKSNQNMHLISFGYCESKSNQKWNASHLDIVNASRTESETHLIFISRM